MSERSQIDWKQDEVGSLWTKDSDFVKFSGFLELNKEQIQYLADNLKTSTNEDKYRGKRTKVRFIVTANKFKSEEFHPDYRFYISKEDTAAMSGSAAKSSPKPAKKTAAVPEVDDEDIDDPLA